MAYTQQSLLENLLRSLDHPRVDIFIHLDKKTTFDTYALKQYVKWSNLVFIDRIPCAWGAYSLIEAEYRLLERATEENHYSFYHLISGQDILLKSIEEVIAYFDNNTEKEYISFKSEETEKHISRLLYYYPFQEQIGRKNYTALYYIQKVIVKCQMAFQIKRTIPSNIGFGSQFFDISDNFARWIVSEKSNWFHMFNKTLCPDEMFIQTLFFQYSKNRSIGTLNKCDDYLTINKAEVAINRAIDWIRGNPYVWKENDYQMLRDSGLLFARKVDANQSKGLISLFEKR